MKKLLAIFTSVLLLLTVLPMGVLSASAAAPTTYTDIVAGETKAVNITYGGQNVYFRFVPAISGTYTFKSTGSYDTYGHLLDSSGYELTYDDDDVDNNFLISYDLTAGNTYYLKVRMYNSSRTGSFNVTVSGGPSAETITVGQTKTVNITTAGSSKYFYFVPTYSGSYIFASSGSYDTYGYLLSASGTQLEYDDDDGTDRNFSITYTLTAGVTYLLQARMYSSSQTGSFTVSVTGSGGSAPSGDIQIVAGENTYPLFNSGRTESNGYDADADGSNPAPDTYDNDGYDLYGAISDLSRFQLGLPFTVATNITEQATLNIRAWDVDEDYAACPGNGYEYDYIYLYDETTGTSVKLDGHMSGQDDTWNNSIFHISPDLFVTGHTYHFELQMTCTSSHTCGYYCITVRTVSLLMSGQGGSATGIRDAELSADIDASGEVSVNLDVSAYETAAYTLEYKAVHADSGQQRGGTEYSTTITTDVLPYSTSFDLESGSLSGTYIITVFIKNTSGDVVATRETSVGWESVAVTYDANGGSQNLPLDTTAYASGDTVTVLFDTLPSRADYTFLGWALDADAVVPDYTVGGTNTFIIGNDNVTLYAVWRSAVNTQPGTQAYSLFNSGATSSDGYGYNESSSGADYNPDSHSYNNNGYDIYGCSGYSKLTLGMGLSFRVTEEVIENGVLTVYAYDIDEERDQIDNVYLVNDATGVRSFVGNLVGLNETWSTTTLSIPASYFAVGESYHFEVDVDEDGWWTWIRRVSLELTVEQYITDGTITDSAFSASIASDGTVSTELYLQTSETVTYDLEYTADIGGAQKGATQHSGFTVGTSGHTHLADFSLESGAPTGVYTIRVIVKDTWGNTVVTYTCTAGYAYSAVSYNSNGGSQNLPLDTTSYASGDTVTVLFDTLPSRYGYTFLGWATSASATTPDYTAGGTTTFVIGDEDVTLYAVWQLDNGDTDYGDVWDGTASSAFGGGSGTESDPYLIYTAEQLAYLAQSTNNGTTYSGKYIKLMNNLNLNRLSWTPIGKGILTDDTYTSTKAFYGNFDGNGHIIYNMSIFDTSTSFTGLFGCLYGATVTNLGVVDASIVGYGCGSYRCTAGILAGASEGGVEVSHCFVTGKVDIDAGSDSFVDIAGLIGDCYSTTIHDAYVIADVDVTNADGGHAGGVMGYPGNESQLSSIRNGYFYGSVNLTGSSYNPGALCSKGADEVPTNSGFYYNANVSSSAGISVTVSQLALQSTFSGFDFTTVWEMGAQYPVLRGFDMSAPVVPEPPTPDTGDVWDGTVSSAFGGGSGTSTDPYLIYTAEQLAYLARSVNNGTTYSGKYFKLMSNLDLNNLEWTPIGKDVFTNSTEVMNYSFRGTFDGNGHMVYNLRVTAASSSYSGLFGYVYSGTIKNLGIVNAVVSGHSAAGYRMNHGSLVGFAYNATIQSCFATNVNVSSSSSDDPANAGGLIGVVIGTTVTDCYAQGTMTTNGSAGGLIGAAYNSTSTVTNCYAVADVNYRFTEDNNAIDTIGGLVGFVSGLRISDSFFSGMLNSDYSSMYLTGTIHGHVESSSNATVSNCYYATTSSATAQGTSTSDSNFRSQSWIVSNLGWDFTNTWTFVAGEDYPVLQGFAYGPACEHEYVEICLTNPTCAEDGVMGYTCSICGHQYTEAIPATGNHTYDNLCDTDCNVCGYVREVGNHIYDNECDAICNECGYERIPGDHEYISEVTLEPTCGADGLRTFTCSNCGYTYDEWEPATGLHEYDHPCDAHCNVCGYTRDLGEHEYVPHVTIEATCGTDGVLTYICSNCAETYEAVIPATGAHAYDHGCDAECNVCGYIRELGDHAYTVSMTIAPTCGTEGELTYVCSNCGDSYIEAISATGSHVYDHPCDTDCNVCGYTRTVGDHVYTTYISIEATCGSEGECTHVCVYCGYSYTVVIPATGAHIHDNPCDPDCNNCFGIRVPGEHAYVAAVTTEPTCSAEGVRTYTCNHCGDAYTEVIPATGMHVYDHGCDADCNACGTVREPGEHVYVATVTTEATCGAEGVATYTCSNCGDSYTVALPASGIHSYTNACDASCNGCDYVRPVDGHLYDHDYDGDCNVCGEIREVPELPVDAPTFAVDSKLARPGCTFTIAIRIKNNTGIVSLRLEATYDSSVLELVSIVQDDFDNLSVSPLTNNPFIVNWVDAISPNNTTNGVVALVTFRVKEDAPLGTTDIVLSYNADDVYDAEFNNVLFRVESGTVTVADYTPGDANGDDEVNNKDLGLLQQLINEWDAPHDPYAADVNNDGVVNNKDLGLLQRYLSGWGVQIG